MAEAIETADVVSEPRRTLSRGEVPTPENTVPSDEYFEEDDPVIGGLKQQVDEDDWLI